MTSLALVALSFSLWASEPAPSPAPSKATATDTIWPAAHKVNPAPATDEKLPATGLSHEEKIAEATSALERLEGEERSWTAQLVRTLLSLLIVVGLIYLVFKVIAPRLLGVSLPTRQGKAVRVVERTQLDARHAVVVLEIDGNKRFLLATGEKGVQLLADLGQPNAAKEASRPGFQAMLEKAGNTSAADEDSHGKS